MKNTLNLLSFGLILTGIFVMLLPLQTDLNLPLSIVGFVGGLTLIIVEGKFLLDRVW